MKWLQRLGIVVILLPTMLITIFIIYEYFGMCINHLATQKQTNTLQRNLENEISDLEIISVYSETGNTSGTSNHVDCLSSIAYKDYTFDTKRYLKEPRFIGVLLGIVYDHQHAIKDKDEHYALSL